LKELCLLCAFTQPVERKADTPFSEREQEPDPLLESPLSGDFSPIVYKKRNDDGDNVIYDENTPTPKPNKTMTFESVELKNEETVLERFQAAAKAEETRKPYSPVKSSILKNTTTWADILAEEELEAAAEEPKMNLLDQEPTPKKAEKNFTALNFIPKRSVKPLTVPVEFKFMQRTRQPKVSKEVDSLSDTKKEAQKKKNGVTVVKPFRFHAYKKKMLETAPSDIARKGSPYIPLSERLKQFEKTPDRFKSTVKEQPAETQKKEGRSKPTVTVPKSPKLILKAKQPNAMKSTEELQVEEMKKFVFKAKPVDPKVLNSVGDLGVPRIKKSHITIPHSPKIHKPKPQVEKKEETPPKVIKANPVVVKEPFKPVIKHRVIKPVDFKLPGDEISERKKAKFMEELKKKEEEEAKKVFKARPLVIVEETGSGSVPLKQPTIPQSPALTTKLRGKYYSAVMEDKIRQQEEEKMRQAQFKARPAPSSLERPAIPEKPPVKQTTEIKPFNLNTDSRADERKKFDEYLKQKEMEMEEAKRIQEEHKKVSYNI
jgi:hypothetical protein